LKRLSGARALLALFVLTLPLVTPKIRGADEIEYFSYLRSFAFDGDLEFGNEYQHFYEQDPQGLAGFKGTFLDRLEPQTGRHINFAPCGSAILWSPFYLLAHVGVLAARSMGSSVAADGYSRPYLMAVCYGSALYGLLGLLLLHRLLRRHAGFDEAAATWSVGALWLGTPLFYYMTIGPAFSHAASVFTVALLLAAWLTARTKDLTFGAGSAPWALLGAAGGLAALVREQDLFFLIVPGVDLLARGLQQRRLPAAIARGVAMGACALLAFTPQLLAYHAVNGRFGPSRMVARKMNWSSPHFLEVLFDPAHGLYFWAPLLLAATLGLGWAALRRERLAPLLALGLLAQVWINGAVESWTQAGAFGSRRFVSATPVFAWGLAVLVAAGLARHRRLTALALAVAVWWNVSLMVQFGLKLMDRQQLEWPRVALNQVVEVPRHLLRASWLFFTDRERLVREGV
jgi:hypothetical protein